jgi:phosphoribosylformylglycinamidine synthase
MEAVRGFASSGKPVLGICNGFQILCEAGLLPGVLRKNADLRFHCQWVWVRVERVDTPFTCLCLPGEVLRLPIAHGDGNFYAPDPVLGELEAEGRVVFRYCDRQGEVTPEANPNGSWRHIAWISNPAGNVVGLMPHPERAVEELLGGTDGRKLLLGALAWLREFA